MCGSWKGLINIWERGQIYICRIQGYFYDGVVEIFKEVNINRKDLILQKGDMGEG